MSGYCVFGEHTKCPEVVEDIGMCSCSCHLGATLHDCPGGCGAKLTVDSSGFLQYCEECEQQREGVKRAYWRLAYEIARR